MVSVIFISLSGLEYANMRRFGKIVRNGAHIYAGIKTLPTSDANPYIFSEKDKNVSSLQKLLYINIKKNVRYAVIGLSKKGN